MSDLTAEDRAALLAASMACSHAWDAAFRAHEFQSTRPVRGATTARRKLGWMTTLNVETRAEKEEK